MKNDVYHHRERHEKWKQEVKEEGIVGLTKANSNIIIQFVDDMEEGSNVARGSKKGGRSYIRLYSIRNKLTRLASLLQVRGIKDITAITEKQIAKLFSDMERGNITTFGGSAYKSVADYVKIFKAFWHWWMKVNRKKGITIADITEDLNASPSKPKFVYLSKSDLEKLLPYFPEDEQVMLMFLFDSIMRAPGELLSLQVKDVVQKDDEVWVGVTDEASKTFGRTFNLLYSGQSLLNHIKKKQLGPNDPLFSFSPAFFNRKLKQVARQVFGDAVSHPKSDPYKKLSLYDLRHSGAIHLRLLAKDNPSMISLDAIRHRGGWTDFGMLNYYTQFIGLDGKIDKQGMLLKQDQHKLEKELETERKKRLAMEKRLNQLAKMITEKFPQAKRTAA